MTMKLREPANGLTPLAGVLCCFWLIVRYVVPLG